MDKTNYLVIGLSVLVVDPVVSHPGARQGGRLIPEQELIVQIEMTASITR